MFEMAIRSLVHLLRGWEVLSVQAIEHHHRGAIAIPERCLQRLDRSAERRLAVSFLV